MSRTERLFRNDLPEAPGRRIEAVQRTRLSRFPKQAFRAPAPLTIEENVRLAAVLRLFDPNCDAEQVADDLFLRFGDLETLRRCDPDVLRVDDGHEPVRRDWGDAGGLADDPPSTFDGRISIDVLEADGGPVNSPPDHSPSKVRPFRTATGPTADAYPLRLYPTRRAGGRLNADRSVSHVGCERAT